MSELLKQISADSTKLPEPSCIKKEPRLRLHVYFSRGPDLIAARADFCYISVRNLEVIMFFSKISYAIQNVAVPVAAISTCLH